MTNRKYQSLLCYMLLFNLSLWFALPAIAANSDRIYEIEIIIFERLGQPYLNAEAWPESVSIPDITRAADIVPAAEKRTRRQVASIPKANLRLNSELNKLMRSRGYRVLAHVGWLQPGQSLKRAIPVHIYSGMDPQNSRQPVDTPTLEGTVTVALGRYLHIYSDLIYRPQPGASSYRIDTNRRMRSRELHYVDHPLVGMLVLATPYKKN